MRSSSIVRPAIGVTGYRGNRMTAWSVAQLDFARGTPHGRASRVLPWPRKGCGRPPIVNAAHHLLHDALQGDTAKLAQGIMYADGRTLMYGETATGDSRFDVFPPARQGRPPRVVFLTSRPSASERAKVGSAARMEPEASSTTMFSLAIWKVRVTKLSPMLMYPRRQIVID
jgi:hypothetical protein